MNEAALEARMSPGTGAAQERGMAGLMGGRVAMVRNEDEMLQSYAMVGGSSRGAFLFSALEELHHRFATVGTKLGRQYAVAAIARFHHVMCGADIRSTPITFVNHHKPYWPTILSSASWPQVLPVLGQ